MTWELNFLQCPCFLPNYLHDIAGEIVLVLHAAIGLARIILVARSMINENLRSPVYGKRIFFVGLRSEIGNLAGAYYLRKVLVYKAFSVVHDRKLQNAFLKISLCPQAWKASAITSPQTGFCDSRFVPYSCRVSACSGAPSRSPWL